MNTPATGEALEPTREQCVEWLDNFTRSAAPKEFIRYSRAARDHLRRLRTPPAPKAGLEEAIEAACTLLQELGHRAIYRDGKTYTRAQCNEMARALAARLAGGEEGE